MINSINHLRDIPNKNGFQLITVENDGTLRDSEVRKNEKGLYELHGLYTGEYLKIPYSNLIGWIPFNTITR